MAQSPAIRRLRKEYGDLEKSPAPGALARPLETNFLHAHFLLLGDVFYDTPYEGGVYHGVLKFPPQYPMKPPTVILRTPSGRFVPDKKICFSMSDFHPELWNPAWNIRTILTGLVSFMNSEEMTTGGMSASSSHRQRLAKGSLKFCLQKDTLAKELFSNELEEIAKSRAALGDTWPPPRPDAPDVKVPAKVDAPARRMRPSARTREKVREPKPEEEPEAGQRNAKNKKKREREKRRKLVKKFFSSLAEETPRFLEQVEEGLSAMGIDVTSTVADHVCWRTETQEEYSNLVNALGSATEECTLLIESDIGGRSISTFRLKSGIQVGKRSIEVVEIPAPKEGSPYKSGLEHVEFVIAKNGSTSPANSQVHQSALDDFMKQYPSIEWKQKAKSKKINPDVSLNLALDSFGVCSVKFHLVPLADVVKFEKEGSS